MKSAKKSRLVKIKASFKKVKFTRQVILRIIGILIIIGLLTFLYTKKAFFLSARVNNHFISRLTVLKELEKQGLAKEALDSIINEKLIMDEAQKKNVTASETEVATEIATIEEELKAQGTSLESALTMQGQTMESLKKNITIRLLINKLLADKVVVDEAAVKKYFDDNKTVTYKDQKYEDVQDQIRKSLADQKIYDEFQTWLAEVKENSSVVYY